MMNSGYKIVGILGIFLLLSSFSAVIARVRLEVEVARHKTTQTELRSVLNDRALIQADLDIARAGIAALQLRIGEAEALRISERERTAQREKVFKGARTVQAKGTGVVDEETSRKAIRHINEALALHKK